jgi:hypothetical protein
MKIFCRILLCLFLPVVGYVAPCVRITASDATGLQPHQNLSRYSSMAILLALRAAK